MLRGRQTATSCTLRPIGRGHARGRQHQLRGRARRASSSCGDCPLLHGGRGIRVRSLPGRREVVSTLFAPSDGGREAEVNLPSARWGQRSVRASRKQWVGEHERVPVLFKHAPRERRIEHCRVREHGRDQLLGGTGECRHNPQRAPREAGELAQLVADQILHIARPQPLTGDRASARHTHELERVERIAARHLGQPNRCRSRQRLAQPVADKLAELINRERPHRDSAHLLAAETEPRNLTAGASGDHDEHLLRPESPQCERQCPDRLRIQPLDVIDRNQHRCVTGEAPDRRQRGGRNRTRVEPPRRRRLAQQYDIKRQPLGR